MLKAFLKIYHILMFAKEKVALRGFTVAIVKQGNCGWCVSLVLQV